MVGMRRVGDRVLWGVYAALIVGGLGCDDGAAGIEDSGPPPPDAETSDGRVPDVAPAPDGAAPDGAAPDGAAADRGAADAGPACAVEEDPIWAERAVVADGPIQEVAVVALSGEVYVIGGFDGAGRIVPTVSAYDPEADRWRAAAPLPVAMHHANAAAVDGRLWVLGFLRDRRFSEDGRSFVYDPAADAWSPGPDLPDTWHRGASGVAAIDGVIYVVGGFAAGGALSAVHAFDPADGAWTRLPDLPGPPRDHMAAAAVDGQLVVAGGRDARIGAHVSRVDVFDPASGVWRRGADMPTSRGGVAAAAGHGRLYVLGGEGDPGRASGVFPQVEAYDLACDAWRSLGEMPRPRHGTGAAVVGDWLYVPGGADVQAFGAVDAHSRLRVR